MSQEMESTEPRRWGGQPDNQNTRSHGFYSGYARSLRAAKEEKARRAARISPEPGFDSNIESHV
ncbi:hypothetical protein ABFB09_08595 [Dehalogenimonas sp. THU2]|uniref:hypothetical protein n=1 Tax=Dehalogenimonas sp. THU2 TaxID=3151121 RepID=UPI00321870CE